MAKRRIDKDGETNLLKEQHLAAINRILDSTVGTKDMCERLGRCDIDVGEESAINDIQMGQMNKIKAEFFPDVA